MFAYANDAESGPRGAMERRSLVVFLNRYPRAHVRIPGVAEALGLGFDPDGFVILSDHRTGLEYLRQIRDLRENGLELELDGYGCHVFLAFKEVSDAGGAGWAELAHRQGLAGMPDAHLALRRMRDEPVREAVRAVFATRVAEEAFLPDSGSDHPTQAGADAARTALAAAFERVQSVTRTDEDTVSIAYDTAKLVAVVRGVRPRLLAQALAGWAIFEAIGSIACEGHPDRTVEAFDAWDGAVAVGDLARKSGTGDAQAWRAAELARALLAVAPGDLTKAADADGLPRAWFDSLPCAPRPAGTSGKARPSSQPRRGTSSWTPSPNASLCSSCPAPATPLPSCAAGLPRPATVLPPRTTAPIDERGSPRRSRR